MSIFKRLSNVAKGKLRALGDSVQDFDPFAVDEPAGGPVPKSEVGSASLSSEHDEKRKILLRLKAEGLLTEDEYTAKLLLIEQQQSDGQGVVRAPMKRTL